MLYSLENEQIKIEVNSFGAQLFSLFSKKTQTEYLWQGDPAYWTGRAYNLFPFIGRMYEGVFDFQGTRYPSRSHGLARYFEFTLESKTDDCLTFLFLSNEETKKEYPFSFEFRARFRLDGSRLTTEYEVKNTDTQTLICAFGGHPGINVPFGKGAFEEYYLDFGAEQNPTQILLSESKFLADKTAPYPLAEGRKLPLRHNLFDDDAVILKNSGGYVAVRCDKEERYVSMEYSDYPFIGFWHACKTDAPYVCLEPWSALPAVDGVIVDLETKPNMYHVPVGDSKVASFTIELHE